MGGCLSSDSSDDRDEDTINKWEKNEETEEGQDYLLRLFSQHMKSEKCRHVITIAGAGISTSARAILDDHETDNDLYATLIKNHPELIHPEEIFSRLSFKENPKLVFHVAREFFLEHSKGEEWGFQPTPSHHFIKQLSEKGLLLRHYTLNIDGLERKAGIPDKQLVEAHGTFDRAHCISEKCQEVYSGSWIQELLKNSIVPTCTNCNSLVKPDIVFFGDSLPGRFYENVEEDFEKCDTLIVMGTCLREHTIATLVNRVKETCPILWLNISNPPVGFTIKWKFLQKVGKNEFNGSNCKVFWKGSSDDGCTKLNLLMGWQTQPNNSESTKEEQPILYL